LTFFVIAGLDPAIHRLETIPFFKVDARHKPAYDESTCIASGISSPSVVELSKAWGRGS
jgi:hypothetical protein